MSNCTEESSSSGAANLLLESLRKFKFVSKSLLDGQNSPPLKAEVNSECIKPSISNNDKNSKSNEEKSLCNGSPIKTNGVKLGRLHAH